MLVFLCEAFELLPLFFFCLLTLLLGLGNLLKKKIAQCLVELNAVLFASNFFLLKLLEQSIFVLQKFNLLFKLF